MRFEHMRLEEIVEDLEDTLAEDVPALHDLPEPDAGLATLMVALIFLTRRVIALEKAVKQLQEGRST